MRSGGITGFSDYFKGWLRFERQRESVTRKDSQLIKNTTISRFGANLTFSFSKV